MQSSAAGVEGAKDMSVSASDSKHDLQIKDDHQPPGVVLQGSLFRPPHTTQQQAEAIHDEPRRSERLDDGRQSQHPQTEGDQDDDDAAIVKVQEKNKDDTARGQDKSDGVKRRKQRKSVLMQAHDDGDVQKQDKNTAVAEKIQNSISAQDEQQHGDGVGGVQAQPKDASVRGKIQDASLHGRVRKEELDKNESMHAQQAEVGAMGGGVQVPKESLSVAERTRDDNVKVQTEVGDMGGGGMHVPKESAAVGERRKDDDSVQLRAKNQAADEAKHGGNHQGEDAVLKDNKSVTMHGRRSRRGTTVHEQRKVDDDVVDVVGKNESVVGTHGRLPERGDVHAQNKDEKGGVLGHKKSESMQGRQPEHGAVHARSKDDEGGVLGRNNKKEGTQGMPARGAVHEQNKDDDGVPGHSQSDSMHGQLPEQGAVHEQNQEGVLGHSKSVSTQELPEHGAMSERDKDDGGVLGRTKSVSMHGMPEHVSDRDKDDGGVLGHIKSVSVHGRRAKRGAVHEQGNTDNDGGVVRHSQNDSAQAQSKCDAVIGHTKDLHAPGHGNDASMQAQSKSDAVVEHAKVLNFIDDGSMQAQSTGVREQDYGESVRRDKDSGVQGHDDDQVVSGQHKNEAVLKQQNHDELGDKDGGVRGRDDDQVVSVQHKNEVNLEKRNHDESVRRDKDSGVQGHDDNQDVSVQHKNVAVHEQANSDSVRGDKDVRGDMDCVRGDKDGDMDCVQAKNKELPLEVRLKSDCEHVCVCVCVYACAYVCCECVYMCVYIYTYI
jgi:hypothetical protein